MLNSKAVLINIIGNLIAFAPFWFFVPLLLQNKIKNIKSFILFMIGIVFLAEGLQFFLRVGQADIDEFNFKCNRSSNCVWCDENKKRNSAYY